MLKTKYEAAWFIEWVNNNYCYIAIERANRAVLFTKYKASYS